MRDVSTDYEYEYHPLKILIIVNNNVQHLFFHKNYNQMNPLIDTINY